MRTAVAHWVATLSVVSRATIKSALSDKLPACRRPCQISHTKSTTSWQLVGLCFLLQSRRSPNKGRRAQPIVFRAAPRPEVRAGSVAYGWAQSVETETGPMRRSPNRSRQLSRLRKS